MNFYPRRRRQAPVIIIISLIDVLIVLVVFLLVTTTYRNQPAVKLTLPESNQAPRQQPKPGATDQSVTITVHPGQPNFFIGRKPITADRLTPEFEFAVRLNPEVLVDIRADKDAGIGLVMKVWDSAKAARVKKVQIYTKNQETP